MSSIYIYLHFLEPHRLVEFIDDRGKRELRGLSFARWKKRSDNNGYHPFITGTLFRSATIRAAEEILNITRGSVDEYSCCSGYFNGSDVKTTKRKRPTYKWSDIRSDKGCGNCPYCLLLGPGAVEGRNRKNNSYIFRFNNLELAGERSFPEDHLKKIATYRILNRIDPHTGKAFDYFRVWEVEDEKLWHFKGKIEIKEEWFKSNNIDDSLKNASIKLLTDSLKFIDRLCGALCVIKVRDEEEFSTTGTSTIDREDTSSNRLIEIVEVVKEITTIFDKTNSIDKLRTFADAIRALRLKEPDHVKRLPRGKEDEHYIWDKLKHNERTIRDILKEAVGKDEVRNNWRQFCESLGRCLYNFYKDKRGGIVIRERVLGDTELYGKQAEARKVVYIESRGQIKEWIFTGKLYAETPFFFGTEAKGGDHTSIQILLGKDNRYRIPRSTLRGVLRNDLRHASGTGCEVKLGLQHPCDCSVCMIMRRITIMDSKSTYKEPPEIRHRIRKNPFTGTVDEGALFDMEVGPEGITFPFLMRYRGKVLPKQLTDVLNAWSEGRLFLGGSGSTGKGRFRLELEHVFEWKLNNESINSYMEKHGFRDKGFNIAKAVEEALKNGEIEEIPLPSKTTDYRPRWRCVEYRIKIKSPLHTADPIEALLQSGNYDSVVYEKRIVKYGATCHIPVYKGESIRGLVRTAVGRQNNLFDINHEDCTCELCQIFGNEHQASKIRFEDLTVEDFTEKKKFDHVAIDRFTSGSAEKKKFDDYSLAGSPSNPLILKGRLWLRQDLGEENLKKVIQAFQDIRGGFYPLGSKGGIGYGWVEDVEIINFDVKEFKELPPVSEVEKETEEKTDFVYPPLPELNLDENSIYYPHYFLKPHSEVKRENNLIGHERFHDRLFTGRIECTLKTLTPLIIPDTENPDAFNLQAKHKGHQNFKFFRIKGTPMIPGSEIRGVISSVYEALTNSCFRVMEEERYLTRREQPRGEKKVQRRLILYPGRVIEKNRKLYIQEMKECRLPLYDSPKNTQNIKYKNENHKKVTKTNDKIAEVAEENVKFLKNLLKDGSLKDALKGGILLRAKIEETNPQNPNDIIATLIVETDNSNNNIRKGYIKFTGPNMINQKKSSKPNNYNDSWDPWNLNIHHNTSIIRSSLKKKYPRPVLKFTKDKKEYTLVKRAERFFYWDEGDITEYEVPKSVEKRYNSIIEDYQSNYGRVWEKFTTAYALLNKRLSPGDLVYFAKDEKNEKVISVAPVRISRLPDHEPLGRKISDNLRPCERVILEEINSDLLVNLPDKMLFRRHPQGLCPSCRLFGATSYQGRIRFGFAPLNGEPKWLNNGDPITLPLLEKPRPTWSMPDENAEVPGRKFYVHHHGWKKEVVGKQKEIGKTENNRTVEVLDKGNEFRFEVFFENLEEWELGLLLYSLELEPELAHKMGMGKAFGFGSVEIEVKRVLLRANPHKREDASCMKNHLIQNGLSKIHEWFGQDWENVEHLRNLRCLLRYDVISEKIEVRYPKLEGENKKVEPGYKELKTQWSDTERREVLTTPWRSWYNK